MTKFCKDCVYSSSTNKFAKCCFSLHKKISEYYLVDGKQKNTINDADYCSTQRQDYNHKNNWCGSVGKNFVSMYDKNHFEYNAPKTHWSFFRKIKWRIKMLFIK